MSLGFKRLSEVTSGNRWARGPDCTADGPIYPTWITAVWRNAPCIWRDFGSALPFQTRLTQTKPVPPLSNEHGSQVKDLDRRQCCHNKHKYFLIGLQVMYLYFPDTPRTCSYQYSNLFYLSISKSSHPPTLIQSGDQSVIPPTHPHMNLTVL